MSLKMTAAILALLFPCLAVSQREMLGNEEMLKGASIFSSLQYLLFHRRQDEVCSRLGSCCCHPAGAAPPSYVLHDDGLEREQRGWGEGDGGGPKKQDCGVK